MNWRIKSLALSVFDVVGPQALYFVQKNVSKRVFLSLNKALHQVPKAWVFHGDNVKRYHAESLIEFGAGKHLGQNIYLSRLGVRQQVVDLNPMIDFALVNNSIRILRDRHSLPELKDVHSLEALRSDYAIDYCAPVDMARSGYDDGAFDMCISTYTLEHIPPSPLRNVFAELRRILRRGGIVSACIDYSDHYAHSDKSLSKLNYLRFSEAQWRRHNHRLFYQNRLRHEHYREVFESVGFTVLYDDAHSKCKTLPPDLEAATLTGSESDYCLRGNWILKNE